jgi:hypothetical protein
VRQIQSGFNQFRLVLPVERNLVSPCLILLVLGSLKFVDDVPHGMDVFSRKSQLSQFRNLRHAGAGMQGFEPGYIGGW